MGADGSLDYIEVEDAFKRLELDPETEKAERDAGVIMKRLVNDLRKGNMRIPDLFKMIDEDESGYITGEELKDFLNALSWDGGYHKRKIETGVESAGVEAAEEHDKLKKANEPDPVQTSKSLEEYGSDSFDD